MKIIDINEITNKEKSDAIKLLRSIQARYVRDIYNEKIPWRSDDVANTVDRISSQWGIKKSDMRYNEIESEFAEIEKEVLLTEFESPVYQRTAQLNLDRIKLIIDKEYQEKLDFLIFGSSPTGRFNGSIHKISNNPYRVVLIEDGVFHNIHMFAKILTMMTPPKQSIMHLFRRDYSKKTLERLSSSKPIISLRYGELLASIVVYGSSYKSRQYVLDFKETGVQANFCALMQLFVISHEIAHYLLDHESADDTETCIRQEYEADNFAMIQVLNYSIVSGIGIDFAFSAVHSLFHFLSLLESAFTKYDPNMENIRLYTRSPHPAQRAKFIRDIADEMLESKRLSRHQILPLGYYSVFLGKVSEKSEIMMGAVSKQFGAKPHKKWYQ